MTLDHLPAKIYKTDVFYIPDIKKRDNSVLV